MVVTAASGSGAEDSSVQEVTMQSAYIDLLQELKFELEFVEQGGYGRSVRTPHLPKSIFVDSPICLNFNDSERPLPCTECVLMQFVPEERRGERTPCHHIPLKPTGETVEDLFDPTNDMKAQDALHDWLVRAIGQLKAERESFAARPEQWIAET